MTAAMVVVESVVCILCPSGSYCYIGRLPEEYRYPDGAQAKTTSHNHVDTGLVPRPTPRRVRRGESKIGYLQTTALLQSVTPYHPALRTMTTAKAPPHPDQHPVRTQCCR